MSEPDRFDLQIDVLKAAEAFTRYRAGYERREVSFQAWEFELHRLADELARCVERLKVMP